MKFEKVISICESLNITFDEFYMLYCKVYNKNSELIASLKKRPFLIDILRLEKDGLITLYKKEYGESIRYSDIAFVSPVFSDKILKDSEEASKELFEAYADFIKVDNNHYPARNIPPEDFEKYYYNIYKGDPEEHNRILKATKIFVNSLPKINGKSIAKWGLKKYMDSRYYDLIDINKPNQNNDTFNYV